MTAIRPVMNIVSFTVKLPTVTEVPGTEKFRPCNQEFEEAEMWFVQVPKLSDLKFEKSGVFISFFVEFGQYGVNSMYFFLGSWRKLF